eukprot:g2094.t1
MGLGIGGEMISFGRGHIEVTNRFERPQKSFIVSKYFNLLTASLYPVGIQLLSGVIETYSHLSPDNGARLAS